MIDVEPRALVGQCLCCFELITLREDGTVARHDRAIHPRANAYGPETTLMWVPCLGGGRPPRAADKAERGGRTEPRDPAHRSIP